MTRAERLLAAAVWRHPKHYGGFSPDGDFLVVTRMRNSDDLDESNWAAAARLLGSEWFAAEGWSHPTNFAERPAVYEWRAGCSMCGWIEYMMLRADAPAEMKQKVAELLERLDGYPILDEEDFSDREMESADAAWARCSVKERLAMIVEHGTEFISIFAARHPYPPQGDSGSIQERLLGH